MDDLRAQKIGEALIEILNLKVKKNGRVNTSWGDKSPAGLARVVERVLVLSWKKIRTSRQTQTFLPLKPPLGPG